MKKCKKCGRTSKIILLDKNCPFCEPKYYPIKVPTDNYSNTIPQSTTKIKFIGTDSAIIKNEIECALKYALPYWTSEDKDEYIYIVKPKDLERAIESLTKLVCGLVSNK